MSTGHQLPRSELIARGRTAEIYDWGHGQMLKLFHTWVDESSARHEASLSRLVKETNLPTPQVGEVVKIEGRWGIIYEKVSGRTMLEAFTSQPWTMSQSARQLANLHLSMHTRKISTLPSLHERLEAKIKNAESLPARLQTAALEILRSLPDRDSLCHGDFHPGNIIITAAGPIIIDWPDAARGDPLADVARTTLLLSMSTLPPDIPMRWFVNLLRRTYHRVYLRGYFDSNPLDSQRLETWLIPVVAGRLSEGIPEETNRHLRYLQARL